MLVCDQPSLEKWSPDFSTSGLPNPTWTRLLCDRTELCNSLEWTEWRGNPVQVQICDACGTTGCASGGYVHISALRDFVVWTAPRHEDAPGTTEARFFPASAIERFGSIAFPTAVWKSLQAAAVEVPDAGSLSPADGCAIRDAWANGQSRPKTVKKLVPWLHAHLLAADTLDTDAAVGCVEYWVQWFGEKASAAVEGAIASAASVNATIEKLYFDGPGADDWPALARYGDSFVPALGPDHIFIPDH